MQKECVCCAGSCAWGFTAVMIQLLSEFHVSGVQECIFAPTNQANAVGAQKLEYLNDEPIMQLLLCCEPKMSPPNDTSSCPGQPKASNDHNTSSPKEKG